MHEFKKFLQFSKVEETDDGNVVVWGIATEQIPDLDKERCVYAAAVPVYKAWSEAAEKRTTGTGQEVSLGPIRLQHSIDIGGKATKLQFDDDAKQIWLGSKPLNDQIRNDLKQGFYTGYSQGGSYAWRKCSQCDSPLSLRQADNFCKNCEADVVVDYALARLSEVSYVDSPCSGVGFDYVKANGSRELVKFQKRGSQMDLDNPVLTKEQADRIAAAIEKAKAKTKRVAGEDLTASCFAYVGDPEKTGTWKLPIKFSTEAKTKRHIRNALARFEQTQGIPADEKAKVKAKILAAAKEHGIDAKKESDKAEAQHADTVAMLKSRIDLAAESKGLKKGLYEVSRCAELLQSIACLYENSVFERDLENDDSTVPEELEDILQSFIDTFVVMAEEEATELAARTTGKSTKGETVMENDQEALAKAAKKTLAHHFAKSAAHHEKVAAEHEKKAAHHLDLHELHKSHHEKAKAAKADVGADAPNAGVAAVLGNQQEFHKAAAEHHHGLHKCAMKLCKAHETHAAHLHKMSEEHDAEEHEKTVKAIKAETPADETNIVQKTAPAVQKGSIDADVAAEAEAQRNSPEYKNAISQIAKAKLDAEIAEIRKSAVIPDGVKFGDTAATKGLHVVERDSESFEIAKGAKTGNFAGL